MAKISVLKPTGSDTLSLLSAFKSENLTYVVFDSEKVGSMGLPIIYISKLTEKLEKVTDDNEWQSVKNSLKGIINGTSFEYVKVSDTLNADEVYYTPLTLPQSSFELIKSRYVVADDSSANEEKVLEPASVDVTPAETAPSNISEGVVPTTSNEEAPAVISAIPNISPVGPMNDVVPEPVKEEVSEPVNPVPSTEPIAPVMPSVEAASNTSYVATPIAEDNIIQPSVPDGVATPEVNVVPSPVAEETEVPVVKFDANTFMQDKETFLKACENMFDALVSKYQKQLDDLERREQSLKTKEQEVQTKLNDANEHLANAEAREQVANIAHDNAQKVMDLTNLMPNNPNAN